MKEMSNLTATLYLNNIGDLLDIIGTEEYLPPYREALNVAMQALKSNSKSESENKATVPTVKPEVFDIRVVRHTVYKCPNCHSIIGEFSVFDDIPLFCPACGAKLDWSGERE